MLALNLQSQLYQMKVQQADASLQRENDDASAMQQLCSPVRVCLSVLNVQTQHKSFFKRATLQLTPNFTAQVGEDTYVLTVYAIIDSQLKTLIRLDMRDIDEIERLDAAKSGQKPRFKITQCPSIKYPLQQSAADSSQESTPSIFNGQICEIQIEMQVASSASLTNSLVGKTLGDDEIENYIETYARNLARLVQRHKVLRQAGGGGLAGRPQHEHQPSASIGNSSNPSFTSSIAQFNGIRM